MLEDYSPVVRCQGSVIRCMCCNVCRHDPTTCRKRPGPTLPQVIGARARELREVAGRRQDDVARAAADVGLSWGASSVTELELGRRQLAAAELMLMPLVLSNALDSNVTFADLLRGADVIWLTQHLKVTGDVVLEWLLGEPSRPSVAQGAVRVGSVERWLAGQLDMTPGRRRTLRTSCGRGRSPRSAMPASRMPRRTPGRCRRVAATRAAGCCRSSPTPQSNCT